MSFGRSGNKHHYTEKPVELLAAILANDEAGPRGKGWVIDPFAGSGSTLLACEHQGRPCLACEVEPMIAASILGRWHDMTGEEPIPA
jgi:DNA modification methylase